MNIWLISSLTPVNDVAGPLLIFRHCKKLRANGHTLRVISDRRSGKELYEADWEDIRIGRKSIIWLIQRIFWRKYLHWIGEEIIGIYYFVLMIPLFKKTRPDVILTTWMSRFLISSYYLSKWYKIPLAIICHDDFENMIKSDGINNFLKRKKLKAIYKHSKANFCVAEGMENEFYNRYQSHGEILYPIGGESAKLEIKKKENASEILIFGYLGSISNGTEALLYFADCLKGTPHQLYIYSSGFPTSGPYTTHPNIKDAGFFSNRSEFLTNVYQHVDVCIVAQSFDPGDSTFLITNFPSKLIDMCGIGLPITIISPEYSSSGMWANKFSEGNIYINNLDGDLILKKIKTLENPNERQRLSQNVQKIYTENFHPDAIQEQFETKLNEITKRTLN